MARAAKHTRESKPAPGAEQAAFDTVFAELRRIYAVHAKRCVVLHDAPGKYYLGTHEVRAKDGYRTWLGGVEIKKRYVSAHLMPVYAHPDLLEGVSARLRERMQGKSCFNFRTVDRELFSAFRQLVAASVARFAEDGRL